MNGSPGKVATHYTGERGWERQRHLLVLEGAFSMGIWIRVMGSLTTAPYGITGGNDRCAFPVFVVRQIRTRNRGVR